MRYLRFLMVVVPLGLLLSGCESDPVPTAGSAASVPMPPKKGSVVQRHAGNVVGPNIFLTEQTHYKEIP